MKHQFTTYELFASTDVPNGFYYQPNFITADEENMLVSQIKNLKLRPFLFQGFEAKRRVISFGYDYSFDERRLVEGEQIPVEFHWIVEKAAKFLKASDNFAELLITEYAPGSMINWHRDAQPFGTIVGISLLSNCTFRFRPFDKLKQGRRSIISLPLLRRSLYIMQGESRDEWQHSIRPVNATRYSVTLRTLRQNHFKTS